MMSDDTQSPELIRGIGLGGATALNMLDMIGVGPFITLPLIVGAMGGPQAMLGWILGAIFALCDGMVWAELGAAMPKSGGSYFYLKEIYGPKKLGRLISFLFIWQLSFSAPLSIASGAIGLAGYASFFLPGLGRVGARALAMGVVIVAVGLLYRKITHIAWLSKLLWVGVMGTLCWIIFAGLTHFSVSRAFSFPPDAFTLSRGFFLGLGSAMLIATYDYWGYYNVSFLGGEVREPGRTIPRAVLLSIAIVAVLYLGLNASALAVMGAPAMLGAQGLDARRALLSTMMLTAWQPVFGSATAALLAKAAAVMVMVTAFASVFSLLLGYSRIPYAAARDGNFLAV